MSKQSRGLRVASGIFGLIALAQLTRWMMGLEVVVNQFRLPVWFSAVAFIGFGVLSVWLWKLSNEN